MRAARWRLGHGVVTLSPRSICVLLRCGSRRGNAMGRCVERGALWRSLGSQNDSQNAEWFVEGRRGGERASAAPRSPDYARSACFCAVAGHTDHMISVTHCKSWSERNVVFLTLCGSVKSSDTQVYSSALYVIAPSIAMQSNHPGSNHRDENHVSHRRGFTWSGISMQCRSSATTSVNTLSCLLS